MASMGYCDKWSALLALPSFLALFLAGCEPGAGDEAWTLVKPARLERPGVVLFDPLARHEALLAMGTDASAFLCGPPEAEWQSFKAVTRPRAPKSDKGQSAEPFALEVMRATAWAVATDDRSAVRAVVRVMNRWAKGKALTKVDETTNELYAVNRTVLPVIVSWAALKNQAEMDREKSGRIERWLGDLMRMRRQMAPDPDKTSAQNNHHYLNASVDMAWGALIGDQGGFDRGVAAYTDALHQMLPDGSMPLETARGARALWYQRHAIASLVTIAEMAAVQGVDLYGREVDGRSLHTAIRFLIDAVRDPTLVLPYAAANRNPGPSREWRRQDLSFLVTRGHGRQYMAWAEPYRARFPNRSEAKDLTQLLAASDPHFQPAIDDYAGGNMSCYFGTAPARLAGSPGKLSASLASSSKD